VRLLERPWATLSLCALAVAGLLVAMVPASRVLLGAAQGRAASLVHLRPLQSPSTVYDDQGHPIATLQDADYRVPVALRFVSKDAVDAVVDVEDATFWYHGAIDLRGILRALVSDLTHGQVVQGGSTITQQLIKNSLLTPQRSVNRKLHEAVLALRLTQQMTKSQILERYLNTVYFGNGVYGIEAAARAYFGTHAGYLDPAQSALLAGMISNPAAYDPIDHPVAAFARRQVALADMVKAGHLSPAAMEAADREPLPRSVTLPTSQQSPYVTWVVHCLLYVGTPEGANCGGFPSLGPTYQARFDAVFQGGLSIYTAQDPAMQWDAGEAVASELPPSFTHGVVTAAMVVMDPATGQVRAIVPGNDAQTGQGYDVATGLGANFRTGAGLRHPGSSFKPITLAAALDDGVSPYSTVDGTQPCVVQLPFSAPQAIHNAEPGQGVMDLVDATVNSVNCAYLRTGLYIGLDKVTAMAFRLGIHYSHISPKYPDISFGGAQGVDPLEMASAYATLADDGVWHAPSFVTRIYGPQGNLVWQAPAGGTRVLAANEARLVTWILQQVVTRGTGTAAAIGRPVAGKTGTDDQYRNAWFIGYTPQLVAAVWMGDPAAEVNMGQLLGVGSVFGGSYPARIFQSFMSAATAPLPVADFPAPDFSQLPAPKYLVAPFVNSLAPYGFGPPAPPASPPASSPPSSAPPASSPPASTPPGT
jgi:membrane peptidoglycan carboxypeptidase